MRRIMLGVILVCFAFGVAGITSNTNYNLTDHNPSVRHQMHECHKAHLVLCHAETDHYVDAKGHCQTHVNVYGWQPGSTIPVANAGQHTDKCGVPCQEDEPCWDCHTMGNRVCGVPASGAGAEGQG